MLRILDIHDSHFGSQIFTVMIQVAQNQNPEGDLNEQVSALWELKSMEISGNVTENSPSQFLAGFEKIITTGLDGRSETRPFDSIRLSFKENHVCLPKKITS